jgi:hypothetical protein
MARQRGYGGAGRSDGGETARMFDITVNVSPSAVTATAL